MIKIVKDKELSREKYEYKRKRRERLLLKDRYIKNILQTNTKLKYEDLPPELIECKRAILALKRGVKEVIFLNKLERKKDE